MFDIWGGVEKYSYEVNRYTLRPEQMRYLPWDQDLSFKKWVGFLKKLHKEDFTAV